MRPFKATASTVNIDVSSSNQEVKVTDDKGAVSVRVMNNGTATVWIRFGVTGDTVTTAAGIPVGPGVTEVLYVGPVAGPLYAMAIAAAATGKIYFTAGEGV